MNNFSESINSLIKRVNGRYEWRGLKRIEWAPVRARRNHNTEYTNQLWMRWRQSIRNNIGVGKQLLTQTEKRIREQSNSRRNNGVKLARTPASYKKI